MHKVVVAVSVLVPVAALLGLWLWHVAASPPASWARQELGYAVAGALLTVPAAVALGAVHGTGEGVGAFLLWGILAGVVLGGARLDRVELDSETRWLIDVACLAFLGLTVFFTFVDSGYFFLPAACSLLVAWRFAHLRRGRMSRRDLRHTTS